MNALITDYAESIANAHAAAGLALRDAIGHAIRAGELLSQAKAALPHGEFGAFCGKLPFAETTARGYMRLAALDPANRQRVADLPLRAALMEVARPQLWVPTRNYWHACFDDRAAFHVVPALGSSCFHISKLFSHEAVDRDVDDFESLWRRTWSAIPPSMVHGRLRDFGLNDPFSANWRKSPNKGMAQPFGMPGDAYALAMQLGAQVLGPELIAE